MENIEVKDFLADIKIHNFNEEMSLYECAVETCLLAEANWTYILESTAFDEFTSYEKAINRGEIVEDALKEADENNKSNLKAKAVESFKKIASYLYGLYVKFIKALGDLLTRNQFLIAKDAEEREAEGLKKLEGASVSGAMLKSKDTIDVIERGYDAAALMIEDLTEPEENFGDKLRGAIIGSGPVKSEEFRQSLVDVLLENKEWSITADLLKSAQASVEYFKIQKAAAKSLYERSKTAINNVIRNVDAFNKTVDAKKGETSVAVVQQAHAGLGILAKANGIILQALTTDYTTALKVLLKCYNAAGKKDKSVEADAKVVQDSANTFISESIESIFGSLDYA